MGVILGLYVGFWRALGESCGSSGWPLEGGLGKCSGEGPAEGAGGRSEGLGWGLVLQAWQERCVLLRIPAF